MSEYSRSPKAAVGAAGFSALASRWPAVPFMSPSRRRWTRWRARSRAGQSPATTPRRPSWRCARSAEAGASGPSARSSPPTCWAPARAIRGSKTLPGSSSAWSWSAPSSCSAPGGPRASHQPSPIRRRPSLQPGEPKPSSISDRGSRPRCAISGLTTSSMRLSCRWPGCSPIWSRRASPSTCLTSKRWEQVAGQKFNLNAPQQLAKVLFEDLRLKVGKRTKTGYSTDADTLEALRDEHPIIGLILEYRQLSKLKSTYVDALPQLVDPLSGRVHTSFGQASTATGRLASSNPNLMNIPIRTELGQRIRRAFKAGRPDHVMVSADYSQIELRIAAHLSGDPKLLEAFAAGQDIHTATAAAVFKI
ncbi:MAG: hypothetical protein E6I05_08450, partial [Chloroflexi bacterium]